MDTFAAFVRDLSAALDEPGTTGVELARRAHLSRFHFDRLITATAGEPPARLRRRVLLERAAYRLTTTTATILAIAVEAGYSSHEAFTRAFARSFGEPPARWRQQPGPWRIAAPNGVHFHPPAGLLMPARRKVSSMNLVRGMLDHHVWLVDQMLARAATLDDARLDTPITVSVTGVDDNPTLRSLLSRLVGQLDQWSAAVEGRAYDWAVERGRSVADTRARLALAGPAFLAHCDEERLDEAIVCPGEPVEVYSLGGVIAHVLTFGAHRRTLVAGALYDAGFDDLHGGDPAGWIGRAAT